MSTNPQENNDQRSQQQPASNENSNQTPISKAVQESDESMEELRRKTDTVTHVNESKDHKETPWSPGQETSGNQ